MSKKLESIFQQEVKNEIEKMLPGCIILKNDEFYRQGIPDLTILYGKKYAILECKRDANSPYRPNQVYYLDMFSDWRVFARTIYPENKEEILYELQQALRP